MKKHRWLVLILLFNLLLGACGGGATPQPTPLAATPIPTQPAAQEYPAPAVDSYPAPGLQAAEPQGANILYPDLKSGDQVEWFQAVSLFRNGEVTQVTQAHDLKVTLTLQDGRTLVTVEPAIDDVVKAIQDCGEPCKAIQVATE